MSQDAARDAFRRDPAALPGQIGRWFQEHPPALVDAHKWMKMRCSGESSTTHLGLFKFMVEEHSYPYLDPKALAAFLKHTFPDKYPHK